MCLEAFDFSIGARAMRMEIHFDRLNLNGQHTTIAQTIGGLPVTGDGNMVIDLNDMYVVSLARISNLPNGNLNIDSMESSTRVTSSNARMTGFGILFDGTISRMVSAAIPGMVANNQELINEKVNDMLLPSMNALFNEHNLSSLINLMASRAQNPGSPCPGAPIPRTCPFTG